MYPVQFHSFPYMNTLPPSQTRLLFSNTCPDLIHLVVLDYEIWSESDEETPEEVLFTLDRSTDGMETPLGLHLNKNQGNLLIRAYFESGETREILIPLSMQNPNINLNLFTDGERHVAMLNYPSSGPIFR